MSNKIKINLKQYYPELYNNDYFIEVDQEIVNVFIEFQRAEWNYNQKIKYHKSYYSLNSQPYVENESLNMNLSADKMINDLSHKEMMDYIFCCIRKLPKKESSRIIRYYLEGKNLIQIAREDHVSITAVHLSIQLGLKKLKEVLNKDDYSLIDE